VPREVTLIKLALAALPESIFLSAWRLFGVSHRPQVVCVAIDYKKFNRFIILVLGDLLPSAPAAFGAVTSSIQSYR
jgi:hypothetical protein